MTTRKLLNLTRVETEGLPLLRIESTWHARTAVSFHVLEIEELCQGLQRLFPEHFPEQECLQCRAFEDGSVANCARCGRSVGGPKREYAPVEESP